VYVTVESALIKKGVLFCRWKSANGARAIYRAARKFYEEKYPGCKLQFGAAVWITD
jgi:hypothetical protein